MDPEPSQVTEEPEVRKKQSMLSEVLVSGLLKNINQKVTNKLDPEAQSELAGIVSQKVKQTGLAADQEGGISFDDLPSQDHLLASANKGRVSPPRNRLSSSSSSARTDKGTDSLEEDFQNLLKDEEIDIADNLGLDVTSEALDGVVGDGGDGGDGGGDDSYLDDFEALLADSSTEVTGDCDEDKHCDIEADFEALLEKENVVVEKQICNRSEIVSEVSQAENVKEGPKKGEDLDDKKADVGGSDDDDEPLVCDENSNEENNPTNPSEETEQQELSKPVLVSGDLDEQEESISDLEVDTSSNHHQQAVPVEVKEVAGDCEYVQVERQWSVVVLIAHAPFTDLLTDPWAKFPLK